jgi:hypothetical protein
MVRKDWRLSYRDKVVIALAHILMPAAGLRVEETDDDEL